MGDELDTGEVLETTGTDAADAGGDTDDLYYDPEFAASNAAPSRSRPDGKGATVTPTRDDAGEDDPADEPDDPADEPEPGTETVATTEPAADAASIEAQRQELADHKAATEAKAQAEQAQAQTVAEIETAAIDDIALAMGIKKGDDGKYHEDDIKAMQPLAKRFASLEAKITQHADSVKQEREHRAAMESWHATHNEISKHLTNKAVIGSPRLGARQLGLTDEQARNLKAINDFVLSTEAAWKSMGKKVGTGTYTRERAIRMAEAELTGTATAAGGVTPHAARPQAPARPARRIAADGDPNAEALREGRRWIAKLNAGQL